MQYKSLVIITSIVIFGLLETLVPFFPYHKNPLKRFADNLILGLINSLVVNLTLITLLNKIGEYVLSQPLFYDMFNNVLFNIFNHIKLPWLNFILAFLILDFYMYIWHRLMHSFYLGWRFHLVHHTDRWMNISTAYRFHTVEVICSYIPKILLIYIFSISANTWLLYESLFAVSLVFHHSNFALPGKIDKLLSYFIVTPNYHRAHHSQLLKASNSNFSSLLTIWDFIFKTRYYPPIPQAIKLGLSEENRDFNFMSLLKLPFDNKFKK